MKRMKGKSLLSLMTAFLLGGCVGVPDGVEPVAEFELQRYLGTWYEIARLDHSFERGLSRVSANYSMREDGGVRVVNRGYDAQNGTWKEATGRAYPVGDAGTGRLKVSFFGPFYSGYNIIALDKEEYSWAMVCGPNRDYLWILAREPRLPNAILERLLAKAGRLNFATGELIRVGHEDESPPERISPPRRSPEE